MRLFSPVLLCALLAATASAQRLEDRLNRVLLEEALTSGVIEDQIGRKLAAARRV